MLKVEVEIGGKRYENIERAFEELGDKLEGSIDKAGPALASVLRQTLDQVSDAIKAKHGNPWNGGVVNGSQNLQSRSGVGLRSIERSIRVMLGKGENLVAGQISAGKLSFHETGGVIKATRSQYLTIPLPAAMDGRGVPLKRRARDWDNTFVKRSKKGNLLIFRSIPGSNQITPLYILKTSVYIPARLRMGKEIESQLPYFEAKALEAISNMLDKAT